MLISLRTQFENLGDLLINRAAIEILSANSPELHFDTRGVPGWYSKLVTEDFSKSIRERSIKCKGSSRKNLIIKPGGHSGVSDLKGASRAILHGLYLWLYRLRGYRITMMPSSVGRSLPRYSAAHWFSLSPINAILIRDQISFDIIQGLGIKSAVICPDLACHYSGEQSIFSCTEAEGRRNREWVTFSFRFDRDHARKRLLDTIRRLENCPETTVAISQVFFDNARTREIASSMNCDSRFYDGSISSIESIRDSYLRSEYVISDRLHVLLLGALNGARPVACLTAGMDNKVLAGMAQIGLTGLALFNKEGELIQFSPPDDRLKMLSLLSKQKTLVHSRIAEALIK